MSGLTSQPNLGSIVEALRHSRARHRPRPGALCAISRYWEQVRQLLRAVRERHARGRVRGVRARHARRAVHESARAGALARPRRSRWPEVAQAYADVNQMFGDIVKVTPSSKVVGDMALFMVTSGLTPEQVLDPHTRDRVSRVGGADVARRSRPAATAASRPALQKKVLQGAASRSHERPGRDAAAGSISRQSASKLDAEARPRRRPTREFASYLMYPKVFLDYATDRPTYGDSAVLPTPVFFYGMEPGEEVSVDIERGKTLIVRFVAVGEAHDDGTRTVFFELNGQPRSIVVTDRSRRCAKRPPQRKAETGNANHVGAPMPGTVATVRGQRRRRRSRRGDLLLTIEAMKMETSVRADRRRHRRGGGDASRASRWTRRICWWCWRRVYNATRLGGAESVTLRVVDADLLQPPRASRRSRPIPRSSSCP